MQYRQIGKLDENVSALGFGCMRLPTLDSSSGNIDQAETTKMLRRAIDEGVNYMDTAYVYHDQMSEVALGIALQDGYRKKVNIATKLPVRMVNQTSDFEKMLDEQLRRLQTDVIDFYLLHALNRQLWQKTEQMDIIRHAEAALAAGKIRYFGFSFHDSVDIFKMIVDAYEDWDFCQIQYNYMDVDYQAGAEGLHYAASKGLGVVIMEPLRGGRLAKDIPAAQSLWSMASEKRTPADWSFQWLWSRPEVSLVLSGMSTMAQVEENLDSAKYSKIGLLNEGDLEIIDQIREKVKDLCPIPCTTCGYCMPCPNGVNIPLNFDVYNRAAMYDEMKESRFDYNNFIFENERALNCIQCDECLPKCPQNIAISTWMPVIDKVLGYNQPYVKSVE